MTEPFLFAATEVDLDARDLPALKANFLVHRIEDGGVLLEVGCGGGKMLRTIKHHRRHVTLLGCDVSEPERVERDFVFTPVDASTGRLPYADASVDVALVCDVLEHVEQPKTTLQEIRRILRPDGRLLAFVPIEGEPVSWYRLFRLLLGRDLYAKTKGHVQAYTHAGLAEMLSDGFRVEERRYAYHPLGQLMDAALCASLSVGWVRRAFWTHSPYHGRDDDEASRSIFGRVFAALLRAANVAAWAESTLLRHVQMGSAGVLFVARPRS